MNGERPITAARLVFSDDDRARVLALIDDCLRTGSLTLGARTREFEEAFAARCGIPHAVAVSSGTAALEIILRALGVGGRQVVVPTNTFFATAAAVLHAGATVRFADVAADTMALSARTVAAALTDQTAAVIVVHIGGVISPEVPAIRDMCARRGIALVEDAAHAHGSSLDGRAAGAFGVAAAFSFYPTKVITSAEGGMIVTTDEGLAEEARIYRDQGKGSFLGAEHVRLGYAWRLSELHAAVGLVHLARLDEFIERRRSVAGLFDAALAEVANVDPLPVPAPAVSNYYKYIAMLAHDVPRDRLKSALRDDAGISLTGEVYATPLHRQPVFEPLSIGSFPVAEDVCRRHICLPVHSDMTEREAARVVAALAERTRGATRAG